MPGPLAGIRVLDLTRVLAGPWAAQNLADLGAEVIKVERPNKGDDSRAFGPPWLKDAAGGDTTDSAYFACANRAKKSITVDLANPKGQAIIRELAARCDVLLENFKFGDLDRYGLGYAQLKTVNPALIYCSLTGMYASVAVCAALAHRAKSGKGQHLDLALFDSIVAVLANQGAN